VTEISTQSQLQQFTGFACSQELEPLEELAELELVVVELELVTLELLELVTLELLELVTLELLELGVVVDELGVVVEELNSQPPVHGKGWQPTPPGGGHQYQSQGQHTSLPSGVVVLGQKFGKPPQGACEELDVSVEEEVVELDPSVDELDPGHSDSVMGPTEYVEHIELSHM
jgi:hypothetical protein